MMNNRKNVTIAKKLTLEDIKSLPKGAVVWGTSINESDDGIVWHDVLPLLIAVPGENGLLIGGEKQSIFDRDIDDGLLADSDYCIWDSEPARDQLCGITRDEFNDMQDPAIIQFTRLAYAITYRGFTFEQISDITGIRLKRIWNILTGKSEIEQCEIVAIRSALDLTDDETMAVFFPGFQPAEVARI